MNKITLLAFLFTIVSISLEAQTRKEKIQLLRKSIFTEELQLSEKEANDFFPVYDEYEVERENLQKRVRKARRQIELVADDKVKEHIDLLFDLEEAQITLKRKYAERFMEVLPVRKALYIYKAEQTFRKRLLEKMKEGK